MYTECDGINVRNVGYILNDANIFYSAFNQRRITILLNITQQGRRQGGKLAPLIDMLGLPNQQLTLLKTVAFVASLSRLL